MQSIYKYWQNKKENWDDFDRDGEKFNVVAGQVASALVIDVS